MYASCNLCTGVILLLLCAVCWAELQPNHRVQAATTVAAGLTEAALHDPHARVPLSADAVHEPGLVRSRNAHINAIDPRAAEEPTPGDLSRDEREAASDRESIIDRRRRPTPADADEMDEPEGVAAAGAQPDQHESGGDAEHSDESLVLNRAGPHQDDSHAQAAVTQEAETAAAEAAEGAGDIDSSLDEPPMDMEQMREEATADADHAAVGVASAEQRSSVQHQEEDEQSPHVPQNPGGTWSAAPQQAPVVQDDVDTTGEA